MRSWEIVLDLEVTSPCCYFFYMCSPLYYSNQCSKYRLLSQYMQNIVIIIYAPKKKHSNNLLLVNYYVIECIWYGWIWNARSKQIIINISIMRVKLKQQSILLWYILFGELLCYITPPSLLIIHSTFKFKTFKITINILYITLG